MSSLTAQQARIIEMTDDNIDRKRQNLILDIENLRDRLDRALQTLQDPTDQISALGVVQGQGSDIDRQCGELRTLMESQQMRKRALGV